MNDDPTVDLGMPARVPPSGVRPSRRTKSDSARSMRPVHLAAANHEGYSLELGADFELGQDGPDLSANSRHRDDELSGNLFRTVPLDDHVEHFVLPRG
jgi:hypothetical protein